jgi:hypothetical protein
MRRMNLLSWQSEPVILLSGASLRLCVKQIIARECNSILSNKSSLLLKKELTVELEQLRA